MSKTATIPALLSYPRIKNINNIKSIRDHVCYFIKPYSFDGIAVVIFKSGDGYSIKLGKFDGSEIKPNKINKGSIESEIMTKHVPRIIAIMKHARFDQAEYYFSDGKLVDVRMSLNKFMSPGMLKDMFARVIPTQDVIKIAQASEEEIKNQKAILKPSTFKTIIEGDDILPVYCTL